MRTSSPYPMLTVEEASRAILTRLSPLPPIEVGFRDALGLVLAEDVVSPSDLPPANRSSVDGYAVVGQPGPLSLRVLHEITAGHSSDVEVGRETAVRIMTGSLLPPGADAVVMVEDTSETNNIVSIKTSPKTGDNVQTAGLDAKRGQVVLEAGTRIGAPEIGMLATVGQTRVRVHPRPKVAVLATGDEVVEPEVDPPFGSVRDSNRYALIAAVTEAGGEVVWSGHSVDDPALLRDRVREATAVANVLVTSGGVSMGTRDLIKPLLEDLGEVHFGRIAFKPGKPLTYATIGQAAVFGLPGFPVSSLVTFEVFVRPALRRLQGFRRLHRPKISVELSHSIKPDAGRLEYQRAIVCWQDDRLVAAANGTQTSSRLITMVGANALLEIPAGDEVLPAGARVTAFLTGEIIADA
jgi:molybdopterin molybdotransferase